MANNIYKQVEQYVINLFESNKKPKLFYHTLEHTQETVKRAEEIAAHYKLSEKEMLAVYIAAWFHDTGRIFTGPENHEEKSVELMKSFMEVNCPETELIQTIAGCILATKRSVTPTTLLQQILTDADTYHLGTKEFKRTNKQVRKEMSMDREISKDQFDIKTLEFLENHKYYTSYCVELLDKGKEENMEKLRFKITERTVKADDNTLFGSEKSGDPKLDKQTSSLISKGIQTMLRLASQNNLRLSEMADRKANILISVNAIIISVSISVLFRKFETDPFLVVPTIIFLTSSVITIVLSILATRPNITGGKFSKEDITTKKVNLLFFGNFYKASLEDFKWGMGIMMRDPEYLYGSLIKDVYYLGVVLGKKYKLLRIAYNIFMAGTVISVIAFTIAVFTKSPESTTVITSPTTSPL
ncbi:MAG TPA: Pycsar system effector family protein [Chitinophagaceae bacterium]|jgi:predicted metal-dependent HD superfamily phosphohydrolase|nr:Pycsar system effector family protein [Chitinophagaceae bacterium]